MLNQVPNSSYSSVFAPLQTNSAPYAIMKPLPKKDKVENETQKKEQKSRHLGVIIASSGVAVGLGLLFGARLFSKKSGLGINKLAQKLEEKTSKMGKDKTNSMFQRLYYNILLGQKFVVNHSKSFFTIATLKDITFKKAVSKIPIVKDIGDGITKFFEHVAIKTSNISYLISHAKFERMISKLNEAKLKLPQAEAREVERLINSSEQHYVLGFSSSARDARRRIAETNMSGLHNGVWNDTIGQITSRNFSSIYRSLKDPNTYSKFLAEEHAAKAKMTMDDSISRIKSVISISPKNKISEIRSLLNNIDTFINPTDEKSRELMSRLNTHMKGINEKTGFSDNSIIENIAKDLSELKTYIEESEKYKPGITNKITKSITRLSESLKDKKQGNIQDIMDIYRRNLTPEDYKKLNKTVNKSLKAFDKATDLEGDKLFDKLRDLKLGSAIHDVIAMLGSLTAVGWYIGKADNKDERISAALKYGIPAVSSVAMTTICTFGLIASGPSLLIGLGTGLVINRLGKFIDKKRKENNTNPQPIEAHLKNLKEDIIS